MICQKILKEMERYVKIRIPYDSEDLYDVFFTQDDISTDDVIVEATPMIHGTHRFPGAYFDFYKKSEDGIPESLYANSVRFIGFISIMMDMNRKRIIDSQADFNSKTQKYIRSYRGVDGTIKLYPQKYQDVECRAKAILCLDEIFHENGGRKKGLENFYNQLILLNIGLM